MTFYISLFLVSFRKNTGSMKCGFQSALQMEKYQPQNPVCFELNTEMGTKPTGVLYILVNSIWLMYFLQALLSLLSKQLPFIEHHGSTYTHCPRKQVSFSTSYWSEDVTQKCSEAKDRLLYTAEPGRAPRSLWLEGANPLSLPCTGNFSGHSRATGLCYKIFL